MLNRGWGTTKPMAGARIDWTHPLAQGLIRCYLLNEGAGGIADLADGNLGMASIATPAKWAGQGINFDTASSGFSLGVRRMPTTTGAMAVRFLTMPDFTGAVTNGILNHRNSTGNNSNVGFVYYSNVLNCDISDNSGNYWGGAFGSLHSIAALSTNTRYDAVLTWDANAPLAALYLNGSFQNKLTTAAKIPSVFQNFFIGEDNQNPAGRQGRCIVEYAYVWNRALSAADIAQLAAAPYDFIARPTPRAYWLPPASAPIFRRRPGVLRTGCRTAVPGTPGL